MKMCAIGESGDNFVPFGPDEIPVFSWSGSIKTEKDDWAVSG